MYWKKLQFKSPLYDQEICEFADSFQSRNLACGQKSTFLCLVVFSFTKIQIEISPMPNPSLTQLGPAQFQLVFQFYQKTLRLFRPKEFGQKVYPGNKNQSKEKVWLIKNSVHNVVYKNFHSFCSQLMFTYLVHNFFYNICSHHFLSFFHHIAQLILQICALKFVPL